MSARRLPALVLVVVGALALTGCEAPTPSVTVFSGTTSAHRESFCWSSDPAQQIDLQSCIGSLNEGQTPGDKAAELVDKLASIPVRPDATVGISVDPAVADGGWYAALGTSRLTTDPIDTTYFRFSLTAAELRGGALELRIFALGEEEDVVRGLWLFELAPDAPGESGTPPPPSPDDAEPGAPDSQP